MRSVTNRRHQGSWQHWWSTGRPAFRENVTRVRYAARLAGPGRGPQVLHSAQWCCGRSFCLSGLQWHRSPQCRSPLQRYSSRLPLPAPDFSYSHQSARPKFLPLHCPEPRMLCASRCNENVQSFMSNRQYLVLDDSAFIAEFERRAFKINHGLVAHPLLQLPRLIELARSRRQPILYFRGDHSIDQTGASSEAGARRTFIDRNLARPALSAPEVLEQIETCGAWMHLRDVGTDPDYAALLKTLIDELCGPAERVAPGASNPRADIFVSSPRAVTPFHLDEEHNFLLQIRGSKRLSIADGFNSAVLDPAHLRAFFAGDGELAPYSPRLQQHAVDVELAPGEGVHIPSCHPHWVQNGPEVSISLGLLWYSDCIARRRFLYRVNAFLERAGLKPSPPGKNPRLDLFKALPVTARRHLRRWAQR
jgi:hypothetical protein